MTSNPKWRAKKNGKPRPWYEGGSSGVTFLSLDVVLLGDTHEQDATAQSIRITMLYISTSRNGDVEHARVSERQRT